MKKIAENRPNSYHIALFASHRDAEKKQYDLFSISKARNSLQLPEPSYEPITVQEEEMGNLPPGNGGLRKPSS